MRRHTDELLGRLDRALWPPRHPNPLLVVWRWRYELGLLGLIALVVWGLVEWTAVVAVGIVVLLAVVAIVPRLRELLVIGGRGVVVQHRLRSALRAVRVFTPTGRLPALLWTRSRRAAVRVLVWLPAGLAVEDLQTQADVLAAACFADHAEVIVRERRHLAWIVLLYSAAPTA